MQPGDRDPRGYVKRHSPIADHDVALCMNHQVCGTTDLPDWWYECKGHYLCMNCDIAKLGYLEFSTGECVVCMENDMTLVRIPNCTHHMCVACFKRVLYGKPPVFPQFPYDDDVNDAYDDVHRGTPEYDEFIKLYPLIARWERQYDWVDEQHDLDHEREENLRRCPICRAEITRK